MPDFIVDPGDYRLSPGSPCIDAGVSEFIPREWSRDLLHLRVEAPVIDLEGNARPCGAEVDMGAFEFCGKPTARFLRGDCNADGTVDISDPLANLNFQFVGDFDPPCRDALDFDDSGIIDVTDPISSLTHQFVGGPPPAAPGKEICGVDPTDDEIGCDTFARCPSGGCCQRVI